MRRRRHAHIPQLTSTNDNLPPRQHILRAIPFHIQFNDAGVVETPLDVLVWERLAGFYRAAKGNGFVEGAADGHMVDGLGTDDVACGEEGGVTRRCFFVAAV